MTHQELQLGRKCVLILFAMGQRALDKRDGLQTLERLCRARGLSLTIQRRTILEALFDGKDHPTADEVHVAVRRRIPGLSRTTVYRVLDTLVELGVICKIYQPAAPALFDTGTHPHHHLACLSCHKVIDLEDHVLGSPVLPSTRHHGFEISESHVFFRGTCRECLRRKVKSRVGVAKGVKREGVDSLKGKAKARPAKRTKRGTSR